MGDPTRSEPPRLPRRWRGRVLPLAAVWAHLTADPAMTTTEQVTDLVTPLVLGIVAFPWHRGGSPGRTACLVTADDWSKAVVSFATAAELSRHDGMKGALERGELAVATHDPQFAAQLRRLPAQRRDLGLRVLVESQQIREVNEHAAFVNVIGPVRHRFDAIFEVARVEALGAPRVVALNHRAQATLAADPSVHLAIVQERDLVYREAAARIRRRLLSLSPRLRQL
jgi:hypothetical protein